jgi:hypothetical protein
MKKNLGFHTPRSKIVGSGFENPAAVRNKAQKAAVLENQVLEMKKFLVTLAVALVGDEIAVATRRPALHSWLRAIATRKDVHRNSRLERCDSLSDILAPTSRKRNGV